MIRIFPDFYDKFACKADKCRHSCCIGWEIDIDEETLSYYEAADACSGLDFAGHISREETPHFCLTEGLRCPYLREDGLCRVILTLGEDALSDICTEHPRFYNEYSDTLECGLGLCCEKTAELLLGSEAPLNFITDETEEEVTKSPQDSELLLTKYRLLGLLADRSLPIGQRFARLLKCSHSPAVDMAGVKNLLLRLENLEDNWPTRLKQLPDGPACLPETPAAERLAVYFIFRQLNAEDPDPAKAAAFALTSAAVICSLSDTGIDMEEAARQYSAEIEYAEENRKSLWNHAEELLIFPDS